MSLATLAVLDPGTVASPPSPPVLPPPPPPPPVPDVIIGTLDLATTDASGFAAATGAATTRASAGWDWSGRRYEVDEPRLVAGKGLIVEPGESNIIPWSGDLSQWTQWGNAPVATGLGLGDLTASGLQEGATSASHGRYRTIDVTGGQRYVLSALIDDEGPRYIGMRGPIVAGNAPWGWYDLQAVTAQATAAVQAATSGLIPSGDGILAAWLAITPGATVTDSLGIAYTGGQAPTPANGWAPLFTGGGLSALVGGITLVAGEVASTPIETTGAGADRAVERHVSEVIWPDGYQRWTVGGTAAQGVATGQRQVLIAADDDTDDNALILYRAADRSTTLALVVAGVTVASLATGSLADGAEYQAEVEITPADDDTITLAITRAGGTRQQAAGLTLPPLTHLRYGHGRTGGEWRGYLRWVPAIGAGVPPTPPTPATVTIEIRGASDPMGDASNGGPWALAYLAVNGEPVSEPLPLDRERGASPPALISVEVEHDFAAGDSLSVVVPNDLYLGPGLDRNGIIQSVTIDPYGTNLVLTPPTGIYYPPGRAAQSGIETLWYGGELRWPDAGQLLAGGGTAPPVLPPPPPTASDFDIFIDVEGSDADPGYTYGTAKRTLAAARAIAGPQARIGLSRGAAQIWREQLWLDNASRHAGITIGSHGDGRLPQILGPSTILTPQAYSGNVRRAQLGSLEGMSDASSFGGGSHPARFLATVVLVVTAAGVETLLHRVPSIDRVNGPGKFAHVGGWLYCWTAAAPIAYEVPLRNPIKIAADNVTLQDLEIGQSRDIGILGSGASRLQILRSTIRRCGLYGIDVLGRSYDQAFVGPTIADCLIEDTHASGISLSASDKGDLPNRMSAISVVRNVVRRTCQGEVWAFIGTTTDGFYSAGIKTYCGIHDRASWGWYGEIAHNLVEDAGNLLIPWGEYNADDRMVGDHGQGIWIDTTSGLIRVRQNVVRRTRGAGVMVELCPGQPIEVIDNLLEDNGYQHNNWTGNICLARGDSVTLVAHNTCRRARKGGSIVIQSVAGLNTSHGIGAVPQTVTGCMIRDNILEPAAGVAHVREATAGGPRSTYLRNNVGGGPLRFERATADGVWGGYPAATSVAAWEAAEGKAGGTTQSQAQDPLLAADGTLRPGSPCIIAATDGSNIGRRAA